MPTPFPGMDPYLERRQRWNAVHTRLIVAIADELGPKVRPKYRVDIELRTYIAFLTSDSPVGVPDVLVMSSPSQTTEQMSGALVTARAVSTPAPEFIELPMPTELIERYLVVREVATEEVITVIEILLLANKLTSEGREEYLRKRTTILTSQTNLLEIDLLRAGDPIPPFQVDEGGYRILVSAAIERPMARVFRFGIRNQIPDVSVPIRPGDDEPILSLNPILHQVYERGSYDLAIDYDMPAEPPLSSDDAEWFRSIQ
ncbi:DUF4058 family protein [Chloroflexi bacterium TSY]|nr:DUF4058 family protein [Chloroflexi bacterium TSY]